MKSNPLIDVYRLFFPKLCYVCGEKITDTQFCFCNSCRWEIPLTGFYNKENNPVKEKIGKFFPLSQACSFYFYVQENQFRDFIHNFKYKGRWRLARDMGLWFGEELAGGGLYSYVDMIVPVPLHWQRLLRRGYNQSAYIAEGLSAALGKPVARRILIRRSNNRSQTKQSKAGRWENVKGIFRIGKNAKLSGKHILLVDDVLTTGSTLVSCAEAILRAFPDCRVSVVTLAVSKKELQIKKKLLKNKE